MLLPLHTYLRGTSRRRPLRSGLGSRYWKAAAAAPAVADAAAAAVANAAAARTRSDAAAEGSAPVNLSASLREQQHTKTVYCPVPMYWAVRMDLAELQNE